MKSSSVSKRQPISRIALMDVCGPPGLALFANFISFGILLETADLHILYGLLMTLFIYALPGQIVLIDGISADVSLATIALLVLLINARLLPMAITIGGVLTRSPHSTLGYYLSAHFVAVTGWLNFMSRYHQVGIARAFAYFVHSNLFLWGFAFSGMLVGFYAADLMPPSLVASLLLLNPLYFLCLIAQSGSKNLYIAIAIISGAVLYLPLNWLVPGWGLLLAGLSGGILTAFLASRKNA